jgi:FAD/FMN-containing dehydrogenase/Fe-S oxidoreductase
MSLAELPVLAAPPSTAGASGGRQPPVSVDVGGLHALLKAMVSGEVRFDRLSRALYSTDASVYQIVPLGVVLPRTEADVVATVQACAQFGVPLTARGGGTSQAGQAIGPGIQFDCSRYLNQILEINAGERWVRVQPGCVLDDLNLAVRPLGLQFAPDVSTSNRATIGGMIANNSSGAHSVVYGKTVDHVLELKVVLADGNAAHLHPLDAAALEARCNHSGREGECYRTTRRLIDEHDEEMTLRYPKILRRVGGYNLDLVRGLTRGGGVSPLLSPAPNENGFNLVNLLVGSEGTLGITLEAKLRLIELPKAKALLVVQFTELLDALAATPAILQHRPAAVEVVDRYVLAATSLNPEAARLRDFLQGDPGAILLIEFFADSPAELPARLDALTAELKRLGYGYHHLSLTDPAAQARVWKLRKAALGLSMAQKGDAKALSFVEDTAVSPEHLRDYIAEFLAIVARHGTSAGVYAHASVGCLHVRPVINLKTEEGVRRFEAIAEDVADLVLKYGGSLSGEHGDGLVRSPFQEKMFGPVLYNAFRELKRAFDPLNILNPGKIVDAPPLTSNLRYGPAYVTPDVPTTFDFSADGGITGAAELCAGVGACRKKRDGTMCPSYQATCEEQHSTRGRANALRLAITGQLGSEGLTDPALFEVLDLCLECKACKSECPTNVDMARLKAEFLFQYYRKHGLPWRNWMFGHVARWSRAAAWYAPLSNCLMRSFPGRWLNELILGIDHRRLPPALARRTLRSVLGERGASAPCFHPGSGSRDTTRSVLLFADTFTNYYEPEIGVAAASLCARANCQVEFAFADDTSPGYRCCGRPLISNGLLDKAVAHAADNVARFYPVAATGRPIVACEPSCLLTIQDDYPALLHGDLRRQAEVVAGVCRTFEDFLDEVLADHALPFRAGPERILFQGHCHQRSLLGVEPSLRLLRRIPGAEVIDLDAGCCGMAGSFGYEKEHYEVSRLVGEQRLFPALRHADPATVVAASGFSCRMQIGHFTRRTALHPAQVLSACLKGV